MSSLDQPVLALSARSRRTEAQGIVMNEFVPLGSEANDESAQQVSGPDTAQAQDPVPAPAQETVPQARASAIAYEAVLNGYSVLFAPIAGTFEQLARMAALSATPRS